MKALLADDHWIARAGLAYLLTLMYAKVQIAEAASFAEAAEALAKSFFDICLVDPAMPDETPMDGLKLLRQAAPTVPIAVITTRESRRFALQVVELGCHAYILKSASAEDIRRAIERVLGGEISLPANLRDMPGEAGQGLSESATAYGGAEHNPLAVLTPRQRDVLALIATGRRNAEIGEALKISPRTVQIHVSTILKLLGVGNRTEAALLARRHGVGT